jgi:hypothetical protein
MFKVTHRLALGMALIAGLLFTTSSVAHAAPSDAEIKADLQKYIALFTKKKVGVDAFMAKRTLKQMDTNPAQARSMYKNLKSRWTKKYGDMSTMGVEALKSVDAVNKAKAAKKWQVLEVTCMRANSIPTADAACKAATELHAASGNVKRLKQICQGQRRASPFYKWRSRKGACSAVASAGSKVGMKALASATCGTIISVFEKHKDQTVSLNKRDMPKAQQHKNFNAFALKMASCKKWDYLFTKLMHWGGSSGPGRGMLDALAKAGHKVEKLALAFVKRTRGKLFKFEHADHALSHLVGYLKDSRPTKSCRSWVKWAYKLPDGVWGSMNWYLRETKCKGAVKVALKRFGSSSTSVRIGACKTVGKLGKRRHIGKLKVLAKRDGYSKWVRRGYRKVRIWPVREACNAAIGQIKVR